jgi:ketosteroid isomerase-like protein
MAVDQTTGQMTPHGPLNDHADEHQSALGSEGSAMSVVARMYECFNRGDLDTIRNEIFASDLVWNLPGRHPLAGTKKGAEEVLQFFHQLNKSGIAVDLVNIAEWTNDIVVEVHRGHGSAKGQTLDGVNCTHYHVRNGKIAEVQVYVANQYHLDNFFNEVYEYAPIPQRLADPS